MAFEGILEVHSAKYAGKNCLMVGQVTRGFPAGIACTVVAVAPRIEA